MTHFFNGLQIRPISKILHIGQREINIISKFLVTGDLVIVSVYNKNKEERTFHFLHVSDDQWKLIEDTSGTLCVTVYGVRSENYQVVVSGQITLHHKDDNDTIYMLSMNNHTQRTTSLFHIQMEIDDFDVEIRQNVQTTNLQTSTIEFHCPVTRESPKSYIHMLKSDDGCEYIREMKHESDTISCQWNLQSRYKYQYKIFHVKEASTVIHKYMVKSASKCLSFVTHATKSEISELFNLAEKFRAKRLSNRRTTKTIPVPYLYRNKPRNHETIQEAQRTGIMAKYIKDNNGDQSSSINNQIHGLFFSASACKRTKMPPEFSYFGDYRLMIPPQHLLPNLNIYFADFYCQAPKRPHYVTLVLTKPGSVEDVYCSPRLPKLNIHSNKFLYYDPHIGYRVTKACHIECLYTEDINLTSMREKIGVVETNITNVRGRGQSRPEGIPKYEHCEDCNLPKK
ncbi:hypothetical protein LOTGIDRAFT_231070 [Lottia gigantea]|uniref:Phytanoyl-CoA hydroxylase-interacting protein-like C-terminal domain-containing protein n=1 Tax=Lottia gigantea TaxID=225164 RepID=V4B057_LOTGI|nr:hypothetical protein LOTGIDRAFT_231070 [Lottia gigantea]ESO99411.1 hypothetical protein LOTGIDRAFT_231070 [Lottia gigantea]